MRPETPKEPGAPAPIETLTGGRIDVILDEQSGSTHWTVSREMKTGQLRLVVRQESGFVDVSVANIEKLMVRLQQMNIPY